MNTLRCKLFGHCYRDPLTGHHIHGFGPDWSTPSGRVIGVCERCGDKWVYRP